MKMHATLVVWYVVSVLLFIRFGDYFAEHREAIWTPKSRIARTLFVSLFAIPMLAGIFRRVFPEFRIFGVDPAFATGALMLAAVWWQVIAVRFQWEN